MDPVAPLILGLLIFIAFIVRTISDNKTKRLLIEKGSIDESLKSFLTDRHRENVNSSLKWGLVIFGIGLGLFLQVYVFDIWKTTFTYGLMFIFGGLGLLGYYVIAKREKNKIKEKDIDS